MIAVELTFDLFINNLL